MLEWKNEKGTNNTCYWLNLSDNIEVSLFKRNGSNSPYLYNFTWGADDTGVFCHWSEYMAAENWDKAKEKAIKKANKIINNYLTELKAALEILNGELRCNCGLMIVVLHLKGIYGLRL